MSQGPPDGGWGQWPKTPGPPERRFSKGAVAGGVPLGIVGTIGLPLLGVVVPVIGATAVPRVALPRRAAWPVILLAASPGPPVRRGLGLGLVIGWGLTMIVGAGLCIALLASLGHIATGMPLRGDRILRYVTAFCPHCHDEQPERPLADVPRLSGWLAERDGRVWLERGCPTHGLVRTLYDETPRS